MVFAKYSVSFISGNIYGPGDPLTHNHTIIILSGNV